MGVGIAACLTSACSMQVVRGLRGCSTAVSTIRRGGGTAQGAQGGAAQGGGGSYPQLATRPSTQHRAISVSPDEQQGRGEQKAKRGSPSGPRNVPALSGAHLHAAHVAVNSIR